jgi:predicted nucleic acid-binding protein
MSAPERPRVVFDCTIFLQVAARPTGPAAACLRLLDAGACTLFLSPAVVREVADVLSRPAIRRKNPRLAVKERVFQVRISTGMSLHCFSYAS